MGKISQATINRIKRMAEQRSERAALKEIEAFRQLPPEQRATIVKKDLEDLGWN